MTDNQMNDFKAFTIDLLDKQNAYLNELSKKRINAMNKRFYIAYALFGITSLVWLVQGLNIS
ncbi:hypothetical protein LCL85_00380 [Vibrio alginolyticus]|nr:hypothetical protein [Vibrio alginolyticus]